ncbi:MBL fold metallo-hydrolase [Desulfurococcus mucosus]|uniref:Zn-dependent hydrolase of the beta-lactamase fold-like protein n=1 Tax=Desulfurococcus mucosus (strain ATCC 35584 / DSM 2162 / JCM 9187 / O7/1) TaxID=765177 RepID=E8R937_DESM0|nr:MBL fold metallo-hydrolase [Desulfurococcus mucosus]ADV65013.1 Zn-dependent hydrolase of the beta-lactamase fold-like protein [Desulfurococcus mucosus DSM 2162]
MVRVSWHGHACVSILRDNGYTITIDPHDGYSIGIKRPEVKADLVLVTHDHFDHNAVDVVSKSGKTRVLKSFRGEAVVDDVRIRGFRTFHDKYKGKRRGENTVYIVEVDGKRIAHLGDLGDIPDASVLSALKGVDLLITPVGGTFTIEPGEAWSIIEEVKPLNVLPIHYWITGVTLPLKPIDEFLKAVKGYSVVRLDSNSFTLENYSNSVIQPRYV